MGSKKASIILNKLTKKHTITVDISISRGFRLRLFVATKLFNLVGIVLGCRVQIMNEFEKACREWIKGCSCSDTDYPEQCQECTSAFLEHVKKLQEMS